MKQSHPGTSFVQTSGQLKEDQSTSGTETSAQLEESHRDTSAVPKESRLETSAHLNSDSLKTHGTQKSIQYHDNLHCAQLNLSKNEDSSCYNDDKNDQQLLESSEAPVGQSVNKPVDNYKTMTVKPTTRKLVLGDSALSNINEDFLDPEGVTEVKAFGDVTIDKLDSIIRNGPNLFALSYIVIHVGVDQTGLWGEKNYSPVLRKLARTVKSKVKRNAAIIFTSALPCASTSKCCSVAILNESIKAMSTEEGFKYKEITHKFESAPGVPNDRLFDDNFHPNYEGDKILIEALRDCLSTKKPSCGQSNVQKSTLGPGTSEQKQENTFQSGVTTSRTRSQKDPSAKKPSCSKDICRPDPYRQYSTFSARTNVTTLPPTSPRGVKGGSSSLKTFLGRGKPR